MKIIDSMREKLDDASLPEVALFIGMMSLAALAATLPVVLVVEIVVKVMGAGCD